MLPGNCPHSWTWQSFVILSGLCKWDKAKRSRNWRNPAACLANTSTKGCLPTQGQHHGGPLTMHVNSLCSNLAMLPQMC